MHALRHRVHGYFHKVLSVPQSCNFDQAEPADHPLHRFTMHVLQAARQAAEQRSQELSDQVDKLTQQAVEAAVESQSCLEAASQKAAKEAEEAKVMLVSVFACHVQDIIFCL